MTLKRNSYGWNSEAVNGKADQIWASRFSRPPYRVIRRPSDYWFLNTMKQKTRVLLGAGAEPRKGWVNIDMLDLPGIDIVVDVSKGIPFLDNSVDEVVGHYFLSHISDTCAMMEEIYRICRNGARVEFKIPYYQSESAFKDPTQVRYITPRTFETFDRRFIERGALQTYGLKSNFRMKRLTYNYYKRGMRFVPFVGFLRRYFWNIVKSYVIVLEVVK